PVATAPGTVANARLTYSTRSGSHGHRGLGRIFVQSPFGCLRQAREKRTIVRPWSLAVFARRRRVWIVAGGRRACFSRVYHRPAKSPEIAPRRECGSHWFA